MNEMQNKMWARRVVWLLLGAFAVVIAANAALVWFALGSMTPVVSTTAYEDGLAYNRALEHKAQQEALGWRVMREIDGFPARLTYVVTDVTGTPLTGLEVSAVVEGPVDGRKVEVVLMEAETGRYAGAVVWPSSGQWDVRLTVRRGADVVETLERVFVP